MNVYSLFFFLNTFCVTYFISLPIQKQSSRVVSTDFVLGYKEDGLVFTVGRTEFFIVLPTMSDKRH